MSKGFFTTWEEVVTDRIEVGAKVKLPTMFGTSVFTVLEVKDGKAKLASGGIGTTLTLEQNKWIYKNVCYDLKKTVKGVIVD
jgi:hypothetical protein